MKQLKKIRLDQLMVDRGLAPALSKAQALIGAGQVLVNGQCVDKSGRQIAPNSAVALKEKKSPFVSRGGLKLAKALEYFHLDPTGCTCADIGASSGGFTDCLLQNGAALVYAVDVGYGQLAWSLRQDERVVVMERTNARYLTTEQIPKPLDLAVIDAAFISLKLLIPPLLPLFAHDQPQIIALIKPQFEVAKGKIAKGGVVRDPHLHTEVINDITSFISALDLQPSVVIPSPILGPKGNTEFLVHIQSHS